MFKLETLKQRNFSSSLSILDFPIVFSCHNRFVLFIFSLLCTIIVLTRQSVALTITPSTSSSSTSSSESLVMISPEINGSNNNNNKMASQLMEGTGLNKKPADILTPGQQVVNAVPDKQLGDFIMYELAVALNDTDIMETPEMWLRNLEDVIGFYENKLTFLQNVPIYENFSTDLLQWIEQKFNLTHSNVYNQLRSRSLLLCTSDGVCYNIKDIPCYCCPF